MRDPEPPSVESEAMQAIRAWRATERKKPQYTRSSQRAKWTRLAGQLIWYKDQILRAMTWEALEQDVQADAGINNSLEERRVKQPSHA